VNLRSALWDAARERQKLVACEAFPTLEPGRAASDLAKILGPSADRGDAVFAVLEAVLRFGDRERLRAYFDGRLRPGAEGLARSLEQLGQRQFDLFEPIVRTLEDARRIRDELQERLRETEVLPLRRRDGR